MNNFITCSLYLYNRIFFYFYLKERVKHEKNSLIVNFRAFCCRIFLLAVSAENIQDQSSLNLRKEGLKQGFKAGAKDGMKYGAKAEAKDGLKYGLKDGLKNGLKDGAWNSKRTDCRTEYRNEGRSPNFGYDNVGFRIIREK